MRKMSVAEEKPGLMQTITQASCSSNGGEWLDGRLSVARLMANRELVRNCYDPQCCTWDMT